MDHEAEVPLLLNCDQVSRLVGYKRSKIYALMREKNHPFPAQVYRGRWRRADVVRWVAELGKMDAA